MIGLIYCYGKRFLNRFIIAVLLFLWGYILEGINVFIQNFDMMEYIRKSKWNWKILYPSFTPTLTLTLSSSNCFLFIWDLSLLSRQLFLIIIMKEITLLTKRVIIWYASIFRNGFMKEIFVLIRRRVLVLLKGTFNCLNTYYFLVLLRLNNDKYFEIMNWTIFLIQTFDLTFVAFANLID